MAISIADIQAHPAEAMAALIETVNRLGEEIAIMKRDAKLDREDIRDLFEAIDSLEHTHIQPAQKDRGEILKALLKANGGKMLAKDARKVMRLSSSRFSELLARSDFIETKPYHLNKSALVLILKCSTEHGTLLTGA